MAKKKIKRISVNAMDETMKGYENTTTVLWNGLDVIITKTLSLEDMLAFVDSVVKSCFDQTTGAYIPEVKDFVIRSNVMDRYANFTLPNKAEHQYDIVMRSGAYDMVLEHINYAQFSELMKAIDAKIQNIADSHVNMLTRQFAEIATSTEELQVKISELFSGIENEDIVALASTIAKSGTLDEEKIVKAYIEQKSESGS